MPELPEVESVRKSLLDLVLDKEIENVEVLYPNIIKTNLDDFKKSLEGQSIRDIKRKGKYLIFVLNNSLMVSHLRMEGKYFLKNQNDLIEKHDHIIFNFKNGESLRYNDTRKFGVIYLFNTINIESIYNILPLSKVGPEPFDPNVTVDYLKLKYTKSSKPLKTLLLDQSIMSGLGNIYVDEVCFMSNLHPNTKASKLNDEDILKIINSSITVLNNAINYGGTTIRSFTNSHALIGSYQEKLLVHTKTICPNCSSPIIKIRVGGRGTYVCEKCQLLKE